VAHLADDLIAGLEALEADRVVGVGHSLGGVTTLLAVVRRPDLFRGVVFLDPVLLPPRWMVLLRWMHRLWLPWHPSLVKSALRRRRVWSDRRAIYQYFKVKPPFASWHDAALWTYVKTSFFLIELPIAR
jgi:pimeloyl-ACP methyl ester carboxylesterase